MNVKQILRSIPALTTMVALILLATPLTAQLDVSGIGVQTVATGLANPVAITHAGDGRLFITLQAGQVVILAGGSVRATPFLDIRGKVQAGGERGLLSIAFHPDYAMNGYFFVNYTDLGGDTVIARYQVSGNPDLADAASEAVLLRIAQPFSNHNGGQLQFGPDGYLYIATGDGGSANDPSCFAQRRDTLLGKLLRIDVDQNVSTPPFYGIPADNPFVGGGNPPDEVWALGLRNPWRFSFDRQSGDLFLGDVGQGEREEIDRQPATSSGGENYGWKVMEGRRCHNNSGSGCPMPVPPCNDPAYTSPILDYSHNGGNCSVTGGYVYRGNSIPLLDGAYLFGDFCSGTLWAATGSGNNWQAQVLPPSLPGLTSFGENRDGELYLTAGSTLYQLTGPGGEPVPDCIANATTLCLNGGRFRATMTWADAEGNNGAGQAVPLTADAGFFWFFDIENPEVFVKVLRACVDPFQSYWVFAAGLTDVALTLTVTDTTNGDTRTYSKPQGTGFEPIRDIAAFPNCP